MKTIDGQPDLFKSELVVGARFSDPHEFPLIKKTHHRPKQAIPFEKIGQSKNTGQWVHFYTHDRHFERLWKDPNRYLPILRCFDGVISPDFSLYRELPLAMQIWNTYRGRAIAYWLQKQGIKVVPNVRWGDARTYKFAFEGLPIGGTVAISTHGCIRSTIDRDYFKKGLARMMRVLRPATVVNYSQTPEDIFGKYLDAGVTIIQIPYNVADKQTEVL